MKFKAIFIDIDGTLMDGKGDISERNIANIARLRQAGVFTVIDTGRNLADAKSILEMTGFTLPVIGANGSYITDDNCEDVVFESAIPPDACQEVVRVCREYGALPSFSTQWYFYSEKGFLRFAEMTRPEWQIREKENLIGEPLCIEPDGWERFIVDNRIVKCNLFHEDDRVLARIRKKMAALRAVSLASKGDHNIEYNNRGVTKGSGLRWYLKAHGLKKEESMAVGDGDNDLSMLNSAGFGVAMGNSYAGLLKKADYITDSVANDGLSHVLEKFVE